jgi:hypothetical protein
MKKGIKINSEKHTLEYVTLGEDFREIYPIIGPNCNTFACPITFDNEDSIYVDDEGMFQDYRNGFKMQDWAYPILGNGLILGADEEGESVDVKTTIEELKSKIIFVVL